MPLEDRLAKERLAPAYALRESFWQSIPALGWMVESARWMRMARPIAGGIDAVLAARGPVPIEVWGSDPVVRRVAAATLRAIRDEMTWTNDRFRPDDDAGVAFWAWADGLDDAGAFSLLEEEIGIEVLDDAAALAAGTLGEFVEELARRVRERGPVAEASPRGGALDDGLGGRTLGHDAAHELVEEGDGERGPAVFRAPDHALLDEAAPRLSDLL